MNHCTMELLESRTLLAGMPTITVSVIDGDLYIVSNVEAQNLTITARQLPAGSYKIDGSGRANGQYMPLVVSGVTGDVHIALGEGDDYLRLRKLNLPGNLRIIGGAGDDRVSLDRVRVAQSLFIKGNLGSDYLSVLASSADGEASVLGSPGDDVLVLEEASIGGDSLLRGGLGADSISKGRSRFEGALVVPSDPGQDLVTDDPLRLSFDFRNGQEGWEAAFANYPLDPTGWPDFDLESGIRPLPEELGKEGTGLLLGGTNYSDELFMFVKRRLGLDEGVVAGQAYMVLFDITFASDAPTGALGIGGPPGEGVGMHAGASATEPVPVPGDGDQWHLWRLSLEADITRDWVVGNIANGVNANLPHYRRQYVGLERRHAFTTRVQPSGDGELWLLVGTLSGHEDRTELYYQRISVTLVPLKAPGSA